MYPGYSVGLYLQRGTYCQCGCSFRCRKYGPAARFWHFIFNRRSSVCCSCAVLDLDSGNQRKTFDIRTGCRYFDLPREVILFRNAFTLAINLSCSEVLPFGAADVNAVLVKLSRTFPSARIVPRTDMQELGLGKRSPALRVCVIVTSFRSTWRRAKRTTFERSPARRASSLIASLRSIGMRRVIPARSSVHPVRRGSHFWLSSLLPPVLSPGTSSSAWPKDSAP